MIPSDDPGITCSIEIVSPRDFYSSLVEEVKRAWRTLDLILLPPHVPEYREFDYYNDSVRDRIVDDGLNGYVTVRRMVTVESIEKLLWVLKSMDGVTHVAHFNIALIHESCSILKRRHYPLPPAVQIIDSSIVYVVDPVRGYHAVTEGSAESVIIRNPEYARVMVKYYDRWWAGCDKIKNPDGVQTDLLRGLITKFRKTACKEKCDEAEALLAELISQ